MTKQELKIFKEGKRYFISFKVKDYYTGDDGFGRIVFECEKDSAVGEMESYLNKYTNKKYLDLLILFFQEV